MSQAIHQVVPIHQHPINNEDQPTVDARELHFSLKVGRDFTSWIKGRIQECGFVLGEDYVTFTEATKDELSSCNDCSPKWGSAIYAGSRGRTEYRLTLDMAKHLCMMERNDTGHKVRQGFIDYEKQTRSIQPFHLPSNPMDLLKLHYDVLVQHDNEIKQLTTRFNQSEDLTLEVMQKMETLEQTIRLHPWQQFNLKEAVTQKVDYAVSISNYARGKVYSALWGYLKRHFQVATYSQIPAQRYEEAVMIVNNFDKHQIHSLAGGAK